MIDRGHPGYGVAPFMMFLCRCRRKRIKEIGKASDNPFDWFLQMLYNERQPDGSEELLVQINEANRMTKIKIAELKNISDQLVAISKEI